MAQVNWSNWEPGDKDVESIVLESGWLDKKLKDQNIDGPSLDNLDLDKASKLVGEKIAEGKGQRDMVKALVEGMNMGKEQAEFLAMFIYSAGASERDLLQAAETATKVQWLAGCCELCDKNENVMREPGMKFPSGHIAPPACVNCLCCLSPAVVI